MKKTRKKFTANEKEAKTWEWEYITIDRRARTRQHCSMTAIVQQVLLVELKNLCAHFFFDGRLLTIVSNNGNSSQCFFHSLIPFYLCLSAILYDDIIRIFI